MIAAVSRLRAIVAILCLGLLLSAQVSPPSDSPARIDVTARRIDYFHLADPQRRQFGKLQFRGGLELKSSHAKFGGLSALYMDPDGTHFLSGTDTAYWVRGRITYDRDNAPSGIADADIAPMLGQGGRPLAARGWYDTESLAGDGSAFYVGIERVHQIVRFERFDRDGLLARGEPIPLPSEISKLPRNKGLECLALPDKKSPLAGSLIAISERGLDAAGNILGFVIGGTQPGQFSVKRSGDFDITDCAITPEFDLIILERRFSFRRGVAMRMRQIPLATVKPGTLIDGEILIEADYGYQIDNMEGLSVHRDDSGALVLTLVSDDNFSPFQRTILLQFTKME